MRCTNRRRVAVRIVHTTGVEGPTHRQHFQNAERTRIIVGLETHQDGRAADFEPMTTSGSGGATSVGYSSYSTYYNQKFVNLMYSTPVSVAFVLHNNSRISRVQYCAGHYNHLHMAVY